MPQLVKGGKYIFGWSTMRKDGKIKIPDEAFAEYDFERDNKVILIPGSKRSGGFGVSSLRLLKDTAIGNGLKNSPELMNFQISEGDFIHLKNRSFCWVSLLDNGYVKIPDNVLTTYNVEKGKNLLVGRGSGLVAGFIAKGPIYEEALKHQEIQIYD